MTTIREKYNACLLLHAVGDTIGFKNGEWEFNLPRHHIGTRINRNYEYTLELLYEYIYLGGITEINLKGWKISDDTILNYTLGEVLLKEHKDINKMCNILVNDFIKLLNKKDAKDRIYGDAFSYNIIKIKKGLKWNKLDYNEKYGGCGASIRTCCIGLVYYGKKNRDKLIKVAIETSRITHNNAIGYLGGLTTALFIAYAIEGIVINEWPFLLVKLLISNIIDNYIKSTRGYANYIKDKTSFLDKWTRYIEDKFEDNSRTIIENKSSRNLVSRIRYYNERYSSYPLKMNPGAGGDDSVIIAYDCVIDSDKCWEKMVIYSMIHTGDSDSTGCIAAAFFGALYGFYKIPKNNLEYIEDKERILKLSDKLYKKFYKKK